MLDGCQHHALERGGVWRAVARLEVVVEEPLVDVLTGPHQRLPVSLGQVAADPEVAGVMRSRADRLGQRHRLL